MKSLITLSLVLLSFCVQAQIDSAKIKKYQLALPDQWMGNRVILDQLISAAPAVFPKLDNVPFCLKCKTDYTLMFFYDSLVIDSRATEFRGSATEYRFGRQQEIDKYEGVTTYHVKATWVLLYKDSAIAELGLVSTSEKLVAKKGFSMKNNVVIQSSLKKRLPKVDLTRFEDPMHFVNKYPGTFDPTAEDILAVIIERIKKISLH